MVEEPQRKTIEHAGVKMEADVRKLPNGAEEMTIIAQAGHCRAPASIVSVGGKSQTAAPRGAALDKTVHEPEMPIEEIARHYRALKDIGTRAFEDFEHDLGNARARAKKGGLPVTEGTLRALKDSQLWRLRQAAEDYLSGLRGLGEWRKTLVDAAAESFAWRFDCRILPEVIDDDRVGAMRRMR